MEVVGEEEKETMEEDAEGPSSFLNALSYKKDVPAFCPPWIRNQI